MLLFFFSSRRRHTRYWRDWSSDVCSSDLNCEAPCRAMVWADATGANAAARHAAARHDRILLRCMVLLLLVVLLRQRSGLQHFLEGGDALRDLGGAGNTQQPHAGLVRGLGQ